MKSKLFLFFAMFSIWCLVNILATEILSRILPDNDYYFSSYHLVNFYVAFGFSVIAVLSTRYFYFAIGVYSVVAVCCLIPGFSAGSLTGDGGFIQMENVNNSLFVLNEFLLIMTMNLYRIIPLNLSIILSDVIIILFSANLMIGIRELAIWLIDWYEMRFA